ncbi:hypothetical protein F52700_5582 [Fusarium sp. NRRL 52700]|nr:hypothetical protein F52700_5582 [Fusarium sp. NRRL 52700]
MVRSETKSACLALVFLGLMTLGDSITDNLLPALADDAHTQSGHWNLGTAALVLKGVSDIIGQFVIGYVLSTKSKHHAMNLNATSILVASLVTLLSLCYEQKWPILIAVVGPLVRCIGGGSHASAFLILAVLHDQAPVQYRFASYYCTGAVSVVAQSFGPFFASALSDSSHALPGILSGACCLIGFGIVDALKSTPCERNSSSHDEYTFLLPNHQNNVELKSLNISVTEYLSRCIGKKSLITKSSLIFLPQVFFLMAICKSTRPLFKAYIQHRDGVSPTEAEDLWVLRSVMSVVIFGIILPGIVLRTAPRVSHPNSINLHAARISIFFISIGAFMIGLSGSLRSITAALVINTLGVATDLSLLAFASSRFSNSDAGTVMMTLASIESAGTLLGIGVLYPIYQWSINKDLPFLVGGVPYYICGSLYAVTALVSLREEIKNVLTTEGLKKTALYNLKLMDSVINESRRLRPVLLGKFLPEAGYGRYHSSKWRCDQKGEKIVCDTTHMWNGDYYEEAAKFDGYRFLRMREASEQDRHPQLVSTSFDHLGFVHGNHACPGRFFAANKIKIALCHMLLKYDWKLADGVVPKPSGFGMVCLPDLQAKLLIRRRHEELDIDSINT